jgi:NAD(P)-dependent dehydrogenase (short-subunit alcohol dehydrogenase family)
MSQAKVMVIAGYGPGISHAVAEKFGKEGYTLALCARSSEALDKDVNKLASNNIKVKGFAADLEDENAVTECMTKIRGAFGPINVLLWNPYIAPTGSLRKEGGEGPGSAKGENWKDFISTFRVCVSSLVAAGKACCDDLKSSNGSLLVTGDGLALENEEAVRQAVEWEWESLAVAKAAQRKLVCLMKEKYQKDNIFVGELTVVSKVKGTEYDPEGKSNLTAEMVADKLFEMNRKRDKACESI